MKVTCALLVMFLVVAGATACSGQKGAAPPTTSVAADPPIPETAPPYDALPEGVRTGMGKPFTGDFDAMVARRAISVAVTSTARTTSSTRGRNAG